MAVYRYRALWTGVTGSPAYFNVYFASLDAVAASSIVAGVDDYLAACALGQVTTCTYTTDPAFYEFDPATGDTLDAFPVTPQSGVGTGGASVLPPATQVNARLITGTYLGGRLVQGRWNIPYFTEDQNDTTGRLNSSRITALNAAADVLLSSTSYDIVVWSRVHGSVRAVTDVIHQPKWSVLRSRRD